MVDFGAEGEEDAEHELQRTPMTLSQDLNVTFTSEKAKKRVKLRRLGNEGKFVHDDEDEATLLLSPSLPPPRPSLLPLEMESLLLAKTKTTKKNRDISIFNGQLVLTQRQMGILASLFNG